MGDTNEMKTQVERIKAKLAAHPNMLPEKRARLEQLIKDVEIKLERKALMVSQNQ